MQPSTNVTFHCAGHTVDLVSQAGHFKVPTNATLSVFACILIVYIDFEDSNQQVGISTLSREPLVAQQNSSVVAPFLGGAEGATFRARNAFVQYDHVVRAPC